MDNKAIDEAFNIKFEAWKQCLDQTKHFNDIILRIRSLSFVFAGAAFGGLATLLKDASSIKIACLLLGFLVPWLSLYLLDRYYYHILLIGVVKTAQAIEVELDIPPLVQNITQQNRGYPIPFTSIKTGRDKITVFYGIPAAAAFLSSLILLLMAYH